MRIELTLLKDISSFQTNIPEEVGFVPRVGGKVPLVR
jgi:hypothetical protein